MIEENKNIKDTSNSSKNPLKDMSNVPAFYTSGQSLQESYPKANKLITALYMVTDIMDKNEPLRLKLRTLGVEILSDINTFKLEDSIGLISKIEQTLSFLSIASDLRMVSSMNFNILHKEFSEFMEVIKEFKSQGPDPVWLEELFKISEIENSKGQVSINNRTNATRIGVQKGGTLMGALSKLSDRNNDKNNKGHRFNHNHLNNEDFGLLKGKRRAEVLDIIREKKRTNNTGATISDIKNIAKTMSNSVISTCGEKTLQRELVAMVTENILTKTGDKRWSQYSLRDQLPGSNL